MIKRTQIESDFIIIGAGVAGLWLHCRLNNMGFHATLLESHAIGGTQTLSSQGIIHGGAKYTLNGILSSAASAIADMPKRWEDCLNNNHSKCEIDLSDTKILSTHQLMWSTPNLSSKITSFFASKALNEKITPLKKTQYPTPFNNPLFRGNVYQLNEPVIDTPSLIKNLSTKWQHRIIKTTGDYSCSYSQNGSVRAITINDELTINTKELIVTSGEGAEKLLHSFSLDTPKMQRRPLHMVMAKGLHLPQIFAHCVGSSSKPIATITTHTHSDGEHVWYIGGSIAEDGVGLEDDILIEKTQETLLGILPWIDLKNTQWTTHKVNRAEPSQKNHLRPDTAYVESKNNIHVAWPTKLALTPNLSDKIIQNIEKNNTDKLSKEEQETTDLVIKGLPEKYDITFLENLWERSFDANQ